MHTLCEYVPAYVQTRAGLEAYVLMCRLEQALVSAAAKAGLTMQLLQAQALVRGSARP